MIVVVIAGRPVGLGPDAESAAGILMAYQGSTEAGQAVADVIFGKVNPSGKLPVSWPSDAAAPGGDFDGSAPSPLGDQPKFFDQLPGTGSGQGHAYNPLYPFGFGLSYTTFTTTGLSVTPNVVAARHARPRPSRSPTPDPQRHGHRPGLRCPAGQQRGRAAAAAGRVHAGDARRRASPRPCDVDFPVSTLAETQGDIDASGPPKVEPGAYVVQLNENTTTPYQVAASAPFTIH